MAAEETMLKVMVRQCGFGAGIKFLVCETDFNNKILNVAQPLTMEAARIGAAMRETFTLDKESAQTLMDELWNCGLRPTEGTGSAGALAATQKHLEDMRAIAFHSLNVANRP